MNEYSPLPAKEDIEALDDELARENVPVIDRPTAALLRWSERENGHGDFVFIGEFFEKAFRELHPSVQFDGRPFMQLAVCGKGIAYPYFPPVVFGTVKINPVEFVKISKAELERIWVTDQNSFWSIFLQAVDCFDLFMAHLNFNFKVPEGSAMAQIAKDQLQSVAGQLIKCNNDSSIGQSLALSVELSIKAALCELGVKEAELKSYRHDLTKAYSALAKIKPERDWDKLALAAMQFIPPYVESRYGKPFTIKVTEHGMYEAALNLVATVNRKLTKNSMLDRLKDDDIPVREWRILPLD